MNSTLLLAAWSTTTTAQDKYDFRNRKPYKDTPRTRVEGIAVRNERRSLAEIFAECKRNGEAEYAFLRKITGKTNAQIERELTRRDGKGGA